MNTSAYEKLKVFISSSVELSNERKVVQNIISTQFNLIPIMYEDWGAHPDAMKNIYKTKVKNSDIFILVLWKTYSEPTEEEFLLAEKMGKDILIYVKKIDKIFRDSKLNNLIDRIKNPNKGYIYYEFINNDDLMEKLKENISGVLSEGYRFHHKLKELNLDAIKDICSHQINTEIGYLKGNPNDKTKKYIPELYVKREEIESEFNEFILQNEKNACVIVGEAGIGKTNLLCHLAEIIIKLKPAIYINSLYLTDTLEEYINNIFIKNMHYTDNIKTILLDINNILKENNLELIIFIDAINESPNPEKLKLDMSNFIGKKTYSNFKFYISCRDIDWEYFIKNNDLFLDSLYSKKGLEFINHDLRFNEFTDVEFNVAWMLYKKMYLLKGNLSKDLKIICKHPLMLRFLAEGFEDRKLPKDTRRIEIFNTYWERKLEHTEREDMATEYMYKIVREFKEQKVTELSKNEIINLLGDTTETLETVLSKILSENLVTYLNWSGIRVVGFSYEAFLEFVTARWIMYGKEYYWYKKNNNDLIEDVIIFIDETKNYRTLKGVIQYLVMMMEDENNEAQLLILKQLLKTNDKSWHHFIITVAYKLKNSNKVSSILGELASQSDLQISAIRALGDLGDLTAIPYLSKLLIDSAEDNEEIFSEAVNSISKIGGEEAIKTFVVILNTQQNLFLKQLIVKTLSKNTKYKHLVAQILLDQLEKGDNYTKKYIINILGELGSEQVIEYLIEIINNNSIDLKLASIEALGKIGNDQSVNTLSKLIENQDELIKIEAIKSLGIIGNNTSRNILLPLLNEQNPTILMTVIESLSNFNDDDVILALEKLLQSPDFLIKSNVITSLSFIENIKIIPILVQSLLNELNLNLQNQIIKSLQKTDRTILFNLLIEILYNKTQNNKVVIIKTIGELKFTNGLDYLISFYNSNPEGYDNPILGSIEKIGGEKAEDILIELLNKKTGDVLITIIDILGDMKSKKSINYLLNLLENNDEKICSSAAISIGKMGDPKLIPVLITALKNKSEKTRASIAIAFGFIGGVNIVQPLIPLLIDTSDEVRKYTANSLGISRSGLVVEPLLTALYDEKSNAVKISIINSLGDIGNTRAVSALFKIINNYNFFEDQSRSDYPYRNSSEKEVMNVSFISLGKIGSSTSSKFIVEFIEKNNSLLYSLYYRDTLLYIIYALENIGDKISETTLEYIIDGVTKQSKDLEKKSDKASCKKIIKDSRAALLKIWGKELKL